MKNGDCALRYVQRSSSLVALPIETNKNVFIEDSIDNVILSIQRNFQVLVKFIDLLIYLQRVFVTMIIDNLLYSTILYHRKTDLLTTQPIFSVEFK